MVGPLIWFVAAQAQPLVAIVVVDQEARETGYALEIDGWLVEDALPVDVADGESVSLVDPDGRLEPLDVAAGEAWEVSGPEGEAWMSRLDKDVRTDLIAVRGSEEAIEALADSLDAEIVVDGELSWLQADDILFDAPWVEDADALAVDEVGLVASHEPEEDAPTVQRPTSWTPPASTRRRALTTSRYAPVVAAATPAPAPAKVALPEALPAVAAGSEADPVEAPAAGNSGRRLLSDPLAVEMAYTGLFLCKDDVLWLHAGGTYAFRGITGSWTPGAPGVVRLATDSGAVLFRAAIDPHTGHCRDVWSPEETGDAMPAGYDRHPAVTSKRKARRMSRGPEL